MNNHQAIDKGDGTRSPNLAVQPRIDAILVDLFRSDKEDYAFALQVAINALQELITEDINLTEESIALILKTEEVLGEILEGMTNQYFETEVKPVLDEIMIELSKNKDNDSDEFCLELIDELNEKIAKSQFAAYFCKDDLLAYLNQEASK